MNPTPTPFNPLNYDWMNPSLWNPINGTAAVVGVLLTLTIYLSSRKKKSLGYILLSDTSVVSINNEFTEKVKVTYLELPTRTLQLVRFKIINTGNTPIRPDDFAEPLTYIDEKPKINKKFKGFYVVKYPETSQKDITPQTIHHNGRIGLKPLLLNPKDWITVEILNVDLDKDVSKLELRGRIAGVNRIRQLASSDIKSLTFPEIIALIAIVGFYIAFVYIYIFPFVLKHPVESLIVAIFIIAIYIIFWKKMKKIVIMLMENT